MTPKSITVVIPAFNEAAFLPQCLTSLQKQTRPADEIIVIDNNSTDDTAKVAESYKVTVITEKQQGISFARNAGFNTASSDIIARCDADSILPPNWIEHIMDNFATSDIIGVTGPVYFYDLRHLRNKEVAKRVHTALYFKSSKLVLGHEVLFGSNMAITKKVWQEVKYEVCDQDSQVHEDMDLATHLAASGIIKYDPNLIASISSRRAKSLPTYTDYPTRWLKSVWHGKHISRHNDNQPQ